MTYDKPRNLTIKSNNIINTWKIIDITDYQMEI